MTPLKLIVVDGVLVGWTADPLADGLIAPADFSPDAIHEYVLEGDTIRRDPARALISRRITPAAYLRRFALAEEAAIRTAAKESMVLTVLLSRVDAATFVDLDDANVAEGLAALVAAGLLTDARATEIRTAPVQATEMPG